ncbi:5-deoxy-glucuronate isomerase [Nonomuraea ferruginea]|jgi:5-deoxy-glucuronate isomerase|uniref:5-deoxy-glucuronate isomerase n=1 Tax=Nonomuraea ferruginea TaxID=46174 RepID=A0ABT4SQY1_9ACTN|nr:5-deoxy-glucuronate isomerase [Nonomuraea ferruginea]MDA0639460.1 5-deoxy-glucuronate isomerase [Nonomuraea ferruginea]
MTFFPYGKAANGPWAVEITPSLAGWDYSGLRVVDLAGAPVSFDTGEEEMIVLPLSGSCTVTVGADGSRVFELAGRPSVFAGPSDFAYIPISEHVTLTGTGRIALPSARATRRLEPRHVPASAVPVELRGAGQASRQVNNFAAPGVLACDKLVAVEVLTPGGNWSSYPPHKHDTANPGEAVLEEIYYFEVADQGLGYQRVYSSERGQIDTLAEVGSGDVVLVPYGYHGPSMAAPGYDLYYLNVLAGPAGERSMAFCDDPRHAWIRATWDGQDIDPRLPFGRTS